MTDMEDVIHIFLSQNNVLVDLFPLVCTFVLLCLHLDRFCPSVLYTWSMMFNWY